MLTAVNSYPGIAVYALYACVVQLSSYITSLGCRSSSEVRASVGLYIVDVAVLVDGGVANYHALSAVARVVVDLLNNIYVLLAVPDGVSGAVIAGLVAVLNDVSVVVVGGTTLINVVDVSRSQHDLGQTVGLLGESRGQLALIDSSQSLVLLAGYNLALTGSLNQNNLSSIVHINAIATVSSAVRENGRLAVSIISKYSVSERSDNSLSFVIVVLLARQLSQLVAVLGLRVAVSSTQSSVHLGSTIRFNNLVQSYGLGGAIKEGQLNLVASDGVAADTGNNCYGRQSAVGVVGADVQSNAVYNVSLYLIAGVNVRERLSSVVPGGTNLVLNVAGLGLEAVDGVVKNVCLDNVLVVLVQILGNYCVVVLSKALSDVLVSSLVGVAGNDLGRRSISYLSCSLLNNDSGINLVVAVGINEGYLRQGGVAVGLLSVQAAPLSK